MRSKTSWQISCALPSKSARCHPGWNARAEATSLMAISAGLGNSVMTGQRSPDDAPRLIRYHFDRLLPTLNPRRFPRQRMSPASGKIFSGTPQGRVGDHP